ncbi:MULTISPECIES: hypothetical protein [Niastella]|uniref:Uncharacterized protein n=1 Tax=Niastella soli TaxID=2821487 RepID=A0ABS3YQV7_9BACT|nr:hypothetical protein [Niastella soli]MBO9200287.1 hypothetical protein [Niastella soli]
METSQSTNPANDAATLKRTEIEHQWDVFMQQILQASSNGFIGETENGIKIYSFESWLRDTGNRSFIQEYCTYLKDNDFMATHAVKGAKLHIQNFKVLSKFLLWSLLPGIFLYLLVAAFLNTFDISFWSWLPAILFGLTGPILVLMMLLPQYIRLMKEKKNGEYIQPQYVIKYFDNDELTFLKSRNRLFKEE